MQLHPKGTAVQCKGRLRQRGYGEKRDGGREQEREPVDVRIPCSPLLDRN